MNNKNKLMLAIGAGVGLAAGYFANSKKGKQMAQDTANKLNNVKSAINDKGSDLINSANDIIENITSRSEDYVNNTKEYVDSTAKQVSQSISSN